MKKLKRSTVIPLCLLIYLAVMAWMGRARLADGEYLYYFGVLGISLLIIVALYWSLRRKEKLREQHDEDLYGTYADKEPSDSDDETNDTDNNNE
ncbi:MAG: hypothetical protein IKQ89_06020 [Muribaculaceae bacterium]|jgi:hypothetical protein|nr:hypothetical protein [Muribaculaceae bacterium]